MKYIHSRIASRTGRRLMLILLAALPLFGALSCASRTASVVSGIPGEYAALDKPPPKDPQEVEPTDPFERAFWNVQRNTPLVQKYFETDDADKITVKGKCIIEGREFQAVYDLADAERTDDDYFRITFRVEDPRSGDSRSGGFLWNPGSDKTGLLLSFDDDHSTVWRKYFDLFDRFDAKVTFFVAGTAGKSAAQGLPVFCNEALSRGHCIGYHSLHHYNLTKVSREVFTRETLEAAQVFSSYGISFNAFAYPYGLYQPWMHEALTPFFKYIRGFGVKFRLYDAAAPDFFHIAISIDNTTYPDDVQFESRIRLMLLSAKFIGNRIIPLASHDIADNARWGIKPGRLEYVLRTAKELKVRFYTYDDLP